MSHILCSVDLREINRIQFFSFMNLVGGEVIQGPHYISCESINSSGGDIINTCGRFGLDEHPRFAIDNDFMLMIGCGGKKSRFSTFSQKKVLKKLRAQTKCFAGVDTHQDPFKGTDVFVFAINMESMTLDDKRNFGDHLVSAIKASDLLDKDVMTYTPFLDSAPSTITPIGKIPDGHFAVLEMNTDGVHSTTLESHKVNVGRLKRHLNNDVDSAKEVLAHMINR